MPENPVEIIRAILPVICFVGIGLLGVRGLISLWNMRPKNHDSTSASSYTITRLPFQNHRK